MKGFYIYMNKATNPSVGHPHAPPPTVLVRNSHMGPFQTNRLDRNWRTPFHFIFQRHLLALPYALVHCCKQERGNSFCSPAYACHANCWLGVVIITYLRELFVSQEWLMWKWISSLRGALCQRIGDFTCGWSLRSGTQLELRIYSHLKKSLITL